MRTGQKTIMTIVFLVLAIVLLSTSYHVQQRMNRIREEEQLIDTDIVENAPPMVAFTTVALGGFRGLIANFLWLRAHNMQDEGRYFEMVQLASWITMLQPRFTGATAYLAWNMAYNISVTFSQPEDRWRWVQRGIELIRDEALVYNPGDPDLYQELGWLYQHKMGHEMDDAHQYYKRKLAEDMMEVLGTYPVDWEKWAEAPADEEELREFLGEDHRLWTWLERQNISLRELEKVFRENQGFPSELAAEIRQAGAHETLNVYFRRRWLEREKKMESELIARLDRRYGDFDWRLPEAHAIYWASRGLEVAKGEKHLASQRMIFQSLNNAFSTGRLIYVDDESLDEPVIRFIPNIEIVDAVDQAYLEAIEQYPDNQGIVSGRRHFLNRAAVTLFTFGREEQAREYLGKLREDYGGREYRRDLESFVLRQLAGNIAQANVNEARSMVQGYLWRMCHNLALGEFERATAMEQIARSIWRRYMAGIGESEEDRRGLPPYPSMRQTAINQALETFHPELSARLRAAIRQIGFAAD